MVAQNRRIPSINRYWQNYLLCILLHMLLPLLPIGVEFWSTGKVSAESLNLIAAVYAIMIGISSKSRLMFGVAIFVSILFSVAFGVASGSSHPLPYSGEIALWGIVAIFIVHALERYNRHVADRSPFLEFTRDA